MDKGSARNETAAATAAQAPSDEAVLEALEQAAAAVGVTVRYDKLATGDIKSTSGLCKIRGVDTVIVDRRLTTKQRVVALARELAHFRFDNVYLPPAARELIEPSDNMVEKGSGDEKA